MKQLPFVLFVAAWMMFSCAADVSSDTIQENGTQKSVPGNFQNRNDLDEEREDKYQRSSPPANASKIINGIEISINYSSPGVKGRSIWGDLVPYNKIWRTGANEATTIEFSKDVSIAGHLVPAGKYALFAIPAEKEWTIIINSQWDQWGAFKYKKSKDVLRLKAKPWQNDEFIERLTFYISDKGEVILDWENQSVSFKVDFL